MMKNNIRRVPAVKDDNLVGIVVAKDIAALLSSKRPTWQK
jgi:CBS domain-containing protein